MRTVALLGVAITCGSGCARDYLVTRRSADATAALAEAEREHIAVPATDEAAHPVYVRASRLALAPTEAAPPGLVRAHVPAQPRHPSLMIGGAIVLGLGALFAVAGGAVIASGPGQCSSGEEFCGLGQALTGVMLLGLGGGVGLVGIVLTAVGGWTPTAELPVGRGDVIYLPR